MLCPEHAAEELARPCLAVLDVARLRDNLPRIRAEAGL